MTDQLELGGRVLVVFDGRYGFCNAAVRWLARRDGRDRLRFVAAEDKRVRGLMERRVRGSGCESASLTADPSTPFAAKSAANSAQDDSIILATDSESTTQERAGLGMEASTLVVVHGERVLVRSEAVAAALQELPGLWPAVAKGLRAVPLPVRDAGYRVVARVRYGLGGRLEACPLPTEAEQAKFLQESSDT